MNINQWQPVIKVVELLELHLIIQQIKYSRQPPSAVLLIKPDLTMKWIGATRNG